MSFLFPAFLFGGLAIAIPIVLHLMHRRTTPLVRFSAVRFLKQAPVEQSSRRRLRELLLLALRVGALALLAFAFARPYLNAAMRASEAPVTVVALDVSYSMSAPGVFARAQARAKEALSAAPSGHAVAVVLFGESADLALAPTFDRAEAAAAIDRSKVGFEGTRYRRALARIGDVLGARPGAIVIVTDLQRAGWEDDASGAAPAQADVRVIDVGAAVDNVAVADVRTEGDGVDAVIRNDGASVAMGRARLRINGRVLAEAPYRAPAGGSVAVRLDAALPKLGGGEVSIEDRVGIQADNRRFLIVEPPTPTSVIVVTAAGRPADAFYVDRALAASDPSRPLQPRTMSADAFGGNDSSPNTGVVVLLGASGMDRRGRDALTTIVERGGGLLAALGPDADAELLLDVLGSEGGVRVSPGQGARLATMLAASELRHPMFRAFGPLLGELGDARFTQYTTLTVAEPARTVAAFGAGGAAMVETRLKQGRVLVLASDLGNRGNDLPLRPAFVPFIQEAVRYLAPARARAQEVLVADAPPGVPRVPGIVTLPADGASAPGGGGTSTARASGVTRQVAINVDLRESAAARMSAEEFDGAIGRLRSVGQVQAQQDAAREEDRQGLWRYGLTFMLVCLIIEGVIGRKAA